MSIETVPGPQGQERSVLAIDSVKEQGIVGEPNCGAGAPAQAIPWIAERIVHAAWQHHRRPIFLPYLVSSSHAAGGGLKLTIQVCRMESPIITLVVVQGKTPGKVLPFPPGSYYFGRGEECDLRTSSGMVSRQHCLLRVTTTEAFLLDLNSLNGTLVNGVLLKEEKRLFPGDLIQIGPLVFELRLPSPQTVAVKQPAMAGQRNRSSESDQHINLQANDSESQPTDNTADSHPSLPSPR